MPDEPDAAASETSECVPPSRHPVVPGHPSRRWTTVRRRGTELLIVIVGVYAAFLLNRFDTYRRDARRKAQILASLERETRSGIDELSDVLAQNEPLLAEFERRLAAGEMPGLSISMNNSGYSATDDATLLQSGGLELLDVETIELLRTVNGMQRSIVAARRNQFELSVAEFVHLEPADFYDPATRQLKARYTWWPYVQRASVNDAKALLAAEKSLLVHLQSERAHP